MYPTIDKETFETFYKILFADEKPKKDDDIIDVQPVSYSSERRRIDVDRIDPDGERRGHFGAQERR